MKGKESLKICPKCGGPVFPYVGFYSGMIYECKHCWYHGPLTITAKSKKDALMIQKKLRKRKSSRKSSRKLPSRR